MKNDKSSAKLLKCLLKLIVHSNHRENIRKKQNWFLNNNLDLLIKLNNSVMILNFN